MHRCFPRKEGFSRFTQEFLILPILVNGKITQFCTDLVKMQFYKTELYKQKLTSWLIRQITFLGLTVALSFKRLNFYICIGCCGN